MSDSTPSLKEVAEGAPFDVVKTVRKLCQYATDDRPSYNTEIEPAPDLRAPLTGLSDRLVKVLLLAGYADPVAISRATDQQLLTIDGIGKRTLAEIRAVYPAEK